ncbi:MAG: GNAT family N-acetyltransferase [Caldimonas sp.]
MSQPFDDELQARVEDAGINASAPREQLWIDGWLVRRCPGKAKRARCIQAVAPGRMGIDDKLARSLSLYDDVGLRPFIRITPFSQPRGLDARLEQLGMERIDDTRVMIVALPVARSHDGRPCAPLRYETTDADTFSRWVGAERGSTPSEQLAHAARLRESPVKHVAVFARDHADRVVAGGQMAIEQQLAGLYDVNTPPAARRLGHANALCRHLLTLAEQEGARWAYLQVEADNAAARSVYGRIGFTDAYSYHYRSPPATGVRTS